MKKLVLFFICLFNIICFSQNNPQWMTYNTSNSNLSSNSIQDIVIDNQNRKWVLFEGYGLLEIDNENWIIFNTNNSNIPSNLLSTINVDNASNFWAGGKYDVDNFRLTKFDGNNWTIWDSLNSPIPGDKIMSIVFDVENNLWLLCKNSFLGNGTSFLFEFTQDSTWIFHISLYNYEGERQLMFDDANLLWIAEANGLYNYNGDTLIYIPGYAGQYITDIKMDSLNNIWTATGEAGWGDLNKFDGNNFITFLGIKAISIEVDEFNNIWVGTQAVYTDYAELLKYDGVNWTSYNPTNSQLPNTFCIRDLAFDRFGNLWIGTQDSGLVVFNENGIVIPVELLSFNSSVINNDIALSWLTATEINNLGFEIERNTPLNPLSRGEAEGSRGVWEKISFVNGKGTTTEPQFYSFVDENLSGGKYQYRLKQIDFDGTFEYSNTIEVEIGTPKEFSLSQNYPNPYNPSTIIRFSIPSVETNGNASLLTTLKIFDVLGNEITTLVNEEKSAGSYEVEFNGGASRRLALTSGVYYYQLRAGDYVGTKKMILLK